jgi:hypothetical protein
MTGPPPSSSGRDALAARFLSGEGRLGRRDFLVSALVLLAIAVVYDAVSAGPLQWITGWLVWPLLVWVAACLLARRLHDLGTDLLADLKALGGFDYPDGTACGGRVLGLVGLRGCGLIDMAAGYVRGSRLDGSRSDDVAIHEEVLSAVEPASVVTVIKIVLRIKPIHCMAKRVEIRS